MKTYLCGGINGLSDADCRDWRETAKSMLKTETLDPMRHDYRGREHACVNAIVESDLADILVSDFVLVNATRPSWGTAMELLYASQAGRVVVVWVNQERPVSPWLTYHSTVLCQSLEEAVRAINWFATRGTVQTDSQSHGAVRVGIGGSGAPRRTADE